MATVQGVLTGAHKAIQGASVVLYRVGNRGYGSPAGALGMTTTDAAGAWSIQYPKPADDPLVYVVSNGGNLGHGTNAAIGLLSALDRLSQVPTHVTVNEATTVASAYALAHFLDRQTATNVGSAVANVPGLPNAFGAVANLVDITTGVAFASADAFTPMTNPVTQAIEAPPARAINSLAEAMATCIDSSGPTSTDCTILFGLVTAPGAPVPTNTRQAMLNIALNPASQVVALYQLSRNMAGSFAPDLGTDVPNDWTLAINFTGGLFANSFTVGVAIDAEGDAWITNRHCAPQPTGNGCVIELTPQGSQAGPLLQAVGIDFTVNGGTIAVGTKPNTGQVKFPDASHTCVSPSCACMRQYQCRKNFGVTSQSRISSK
jgi:hypothetical protein